MMAKITVVKKSRSKEAFDKKKLYVSIYNSCLSTQLSKRECERIAKHIMKEVVQILEKQTCLLSEEITETVASAMAKHKKELAFMYRTHKDLS